MPELPKSKNGSKPTKENKSQLNLALMTVSAHLKFVLSDTPETKLEL